MASQQANETKPGESKISWVSDGFAKFALELMGCWWEAQTMTLSNLRLTLTAVFEPAPAGGFTCHFEKWPEIFSEGDSLEEARENLVDAMTQVMEYHREAARQRTDPTATRDALHLKAL